MNQRILFFDGECVMCNGIVKWLYAHDRSGSLTFASLQGETADERRARHADFPRELDTFVFVDGEELWVRSRAAFRVASFLGLPWKLGALFRVLPRFLTDAVYDFVARRRFNWFGKTETCWFPPPEAAQRLLP